MVRVWHTFSKELKSPAGSIKRGSAMGVCLPQLAECTCKQVKSSRSSSKKEKNLSKLTGGFQASLALPSRRDNTEQTRHLPRENRCDWCLTHWQLPSVVDLQPKRQLVKPSRQSIKMGLLLCSSVVQDALHDTPAQLDNSAPRGICAPGPGEDNFDSTSMAWKLRDAKLTKLKGRQREDVLPKGGVFQPQMPVQGLIVEDHLPANSTMHSKIHLKFPGQVGHMLCRVPIQLLQTMNQCRNPLIMTKNWKAGGDLGCMHQP